ncbi:NtaA/DmoA family FMN-dependent monooxygenase [Pseudoclavibacter chungangensis]|uniref:NtaA/DmoA family FMN-dependent monooxygenase n=1 Tax=Pseudoclavibacter chungangensis TaxID=587635 RepID=A0A7J5BSV6_9MICO|nr:NtaA/DmoA family FMN-dependent monooxygenase [Pseudoclavibacter chungangensis]KAB1657336.1 NtaA/DmoA family FMN-dependent monooxygenase [Pseudoclavibacter chungangensis]NYJ66208.1 FMN-dependent oxidoreductase (nitrilotriacetate monooxygenase family) [Pseudoclavibacter chungangensis]
MTDRTTPRVHLAAHFPGVNNTTIWSDPRHGSQIEFAAFEHFARTAERGVFDYLFLAEGLRLREHRGRIHDLDVAGRPATLAVLAALAGVTEHIGLVSTLSATFNEPYELARQLATLDHLSDGRAGWNVVTSPDAFHGANFRRGGFLDPADRYVRAGEFIDAARVVWGSWAADQPVADRTTGEFAAAGSGEFAFSGTQFDIHGRSSVPRSPQAFPVVVQAGDSADGRDLAASRAEVIFSRHGERDEGIAFSEDLTARLAARSRSRDSLRILPAVTFALGDTAEEADEQARLDALGQVSPQTAISFLEQVWGRDLSAYDPDGPLPDIEPDVENVNVTRGRVRHVKDPAPVVAAWRERAANENLSIRELVIAVSARPRFVGTPQTVAERMIEHVAAGASDGFTLVGTRSPDGLDEFTDRVVPILQERGAYPEAYPERATLRELLGLPHPDVPDPAPGRPTPERIEEPTR